MTRKEEKPRHDSYQLQAKDRYDLRPRESENQNLHRARQVGFPLSLIAGEKPNTLFAERPKRLSAPYTSSLADVNTCQKRALKNNTRSVPWKKSVDPHFTCRTVEDSASHSVKKGYLVSHFFPLYMPISVSTECFTFGPRGPKDIHIMSFLSLPHPSFTALLFVVSFHSL